MKPTCSSGPWGCKYHRIYGTVQVKLAFTAWWYNFRSVIRNCYSMTSCAVRIVLQIHNCAEDSCVRRALVCPQWCLYIYEKRKMITRNMQIQVKLSCARTGKRTKVNRNSCLRYKRVHWPLSNRKLALLHNHYECPHNNAQNRTLRDIDTSWY